MHADESGRSGYQYFHDPIIVRKIGAIISQADAAQCPTAMRTTATAQVNVIMGVAARTEKRSAFRRTAFTPHDGG